MKLPTDTTGHPYEGQFEFMGEVVPLGPPIEVIQTIDLIKGLRDRLKGEREIRKEAQELVEQYEYELLHELSQLLGDDKTTDT